METKLVFKLILQATIPEIFLHVLKALFSGRDDRWITDRISTPHDVHMYIEPSDRTFVLSFFNEVSCVLASY